MVFNHSCVVIYLFLKDTCDVNACWDSLIILSNFVHLRTDGQQDLFCMLSDEHEQ